jgi:hypothetical protein
MGTRKAHFERTVYGFKWGAAEVTRLTERDGQVCIGVKTDTGQEVDIYVSPTGRSLRVFHHGKGELKAMPND